MLPAGRCVLLSAPLMPAPSTSEADRNVACPALLIAAAAAVAAAAAACLLVLPANDTTLPPQPWCRADLVLLAGPPVTLPAQLASDWYCCCCSCMSRFRLLVFVELKLLM